MGEPTPDAPMRWRTEGNAIDRVIRSVRYLTVVGYVHITGQLGLRLVTTAQAQGTPGHGIHDRSSASSVATFHTLREPQKAASTRRTESAFARPSISDEHARRRAKAAAAMQHYRQLQCDVERFWRKADGISAALLSPLDTRDFWPWRSDPSYFDTTKTTLGRVMMRPKPRAKIFIVIEYTAAGSAARGSFRTAMPT